MAKAKASTARRSKTAKEIHSHASAGTRSYTALEVDVRNAVALITLNRPEVHNAFDQTLIAELTDALLATGTDENVRAVVLLGAGESFCAGADLNWMRRMAGFSTAQNLADARALAAMLLRRRYQAINRRTKYGSARRRRAVSGVRIRAR